MNKKRSRSNEGSRYPREGRERESEEKVTTGNQKTNEQGSRPINNRFGT